MITGPLFEFVRFCLLRDGLIDTTHPSHVFYAANMLVSVGKQ